MPPEKFKESSHMSSKWPAHLRLRAHSLAERGLIEIQKIRAAYKKSFCLTEAGREALMSHEELNETEKEESGR